MNWNDIKKFPNIHYSIDVDWDFLEAQLKRYIDFHGLDMNPDFQRGHIWTEEQQIAFVEFFLKEPQSGRDIYFNHPNWMGSFVGEFVLVDGKQRLEAARRFLNNEIKAYGFYCNEYIGYRKDNRIPSDISFKFHISKLKTRKEVMQWYIDFNCGGTPHTSEEIKKVKDLLTKE